MDRQTEGQGDPSIPPNFVAGGIITDRQTDRWYKCQKLLVDLLNRKHKKIRQKWFPIRTKATISSNWKFSFAIRVCTYLFDHCDHLDYQHYARWLGREVNVSVKQMRPNKKVGVFPVSRPSLFFPSDPKTFYCVWVSNHQNLEIDSYNKSSF